MGFFLNLNHTKSKCVNGCELFNDRQLFSYWESNKVTSDEKCILNFLQNKISINKKKILHVGIGNSYIEENLNNFYRIDGVSLSGSEIINAQKKKIKNYKIYFLNKFSKRTLFNKKLSHYDIIIDVNLKSYACCDIAFNHLFKQYLKMLKPKGIILSGKNGMRWSRIIKPVLSFSFKKFFYKRLKEFDGAKKNILNKNELLLLKKKHNLQILNLYNLILIKKK
jgi:SAM-dependent methyltransferase